MSMGGLEREVVRWGVISLRARPALYKCTFRKKYSWAISSPKKIRPNSLPLPLSSIEQKYRNYNQGLICMKSGGSADGAGATEYDS